MKEIIYFLLAAVIAMGFYCTPVAHPDDSSGVHSQAVYGGDEDSAHADNDRDYTRNRK